MLYTNKVTAAINLNPAAELSPQRAEGPAVPARQTLAETFQGAI